ncbi:hypothetical protein [Paenibacillus amylolyticus]|nr:hypothetical protein [Paenibacillus amylolyticus]
MLTSCSTEDDGKRAPLSASGSSSSPCVSGNIDWADFLMINDVMYSLNDSRSDATPIEPELIGDKVGEVKFTLSEQACSDHVVQNGDAAFLSVGTSIYELNGYRPQFRVVANDRMYQVSDNPKAETMGDLMDIASKVEKISLESGNDGSIIGDFPQEATAEFVNELLHLPYVGFDEVYKKAKHDYGIFLRVHLRDGTSMRMVYYPKANAFSAGAFGTERLNELIVTQRQRIKSAAGM